MRNARFMPWSLALCLCGVGSSAAGVESFGAFVSGGTVSSLGDTQVFDAIDGGIVSPQSSVSYVARNGWMASRILVIAPAGSEQRALIVDQPGDTTVIPGDTARFRVGAVSNADLRYQWRKNGIEIAGATTATLSLPNVGIGDAGDYDVVVSTSVGAVTSSAGRLSVVNRFIQIGSVQTTNFSGVITVPVVFSGNGVENAAAFSVSYNAASLTLVGVVNQGGAVMTTNGSVAGALGLQFSLAAGQTYSAGTNHLCELLLRPVGITNQTLLNLTISDSPMAVRVSNVASNAVPVVAKAGSIVFKQPVSTTVDPGSGGFGEEIMLVTPDDGSGEPLFVRVLIHDLGVDSLGNPIRVLNAAGTNENGVPFVLFPGAVQPGQVLDLALSYYVSDRVTAPSPRFEVETFRDSPIDLPNGLTAVPLSRGLVSGGKFYVDFVTELNRTYYVQYRDGDAAGNWQTSLPAVTGNGFNRQWIDNGPPATGAKLEQTGARFYRVVRAP